MAYDQINPIDLGFRGDAQAARMMSLWANLYRDPKERSEPYGTDDFMPGWEPAKKTRDPGELWREVRTWALLNQKAKINN